MELAGLPASVEKRTAILSLLEPMGRETANIHLGSASGAMLLGALGELDPAWLGKAIEAMWNSIQRDQDDFLGT